MPENTTKEKKNTGKQITGAGKFTWRKIAPKEGKSNEKVVDGKSYKHCQTCRQGKGLWTTGLGLHGTNDHDPTKSRNSSRE